MSMDSKLAEIKLNSKLFDGVDIAELEHDDMKIEVVSLSEGNVLYREGTLADKVYFLVNGEIDLLDNKLLDRTDLISIKENTLFAYEDLIKNIKRTSTAITTRGSFLYSISASEFKDWIIKSPVFKKNLESIFEKDKELLLQKLEDLLNEQQKEFQINLPEFNSSSYSQISNESNCLHNPPVDPFDRNIAREKKHSDKRLERLRQTIVELDEIAHVEVEKPDEPKQKETNEEIEKLFSKEEIEKGFGKIVRGEIVIIVVFLSRATMENAVEFKNFVNDTILFGSKKVIVDLSRTEFIDSTFLGVLVSSLKKIVAKKGDLRLVFSKEEPLGLLQLTRMDKIFNIYNQLADAIDGIEKK